MPDPAILATVWRGDAPEATIRGHIAIVSPEGGVAGAAGDPASLTTLRSAIKPVQALPFADVARDLGAPYDELAVACASHEAEPIHVETVRRLLARVGLDESALLCGPQLPYSEMEAAKRLTSGEPLRAIDNNCSGKHAGMLAACVANDWPVSGYTEPSHPLQQAIDTRLAALSGCDLGALPWGVDGCGAPTRALPLSGLAAAFVRGQAGDDSFRRCQAAMAAHPMLIGGTGRFDTAVLTALGDRITVKSGAMAVWAGVVRPGGPGVAIKLEAGSSEQMPRIVIALLRHLGLLRPEELPEPLRPFDGPIVNRAGRPVGEIRVDLSALR